MELIKVIQQYLEQIDTDFSILINGKWGSGKTFFIRHNVAHAVNKILYSSDKSKPSKNAPHFEIIYVSLFGLDSSEKLQSTLFRELNPFWKTKVGKVTGTLLSGALQNVVGSGDKEAQKNAINIFGGIPKNKVLVFDDLERLDTNVLNEVFGFINIYTEHQRLKVIIIADESKLIEKLNKKYEEIREKLIRFTYLFDPNIDEVFDNFLKVKYNTEYLTFLKLYKPKICSFFKKAKNNNLRTLSFVIDLFDLVFANLDLKKSWNDQYNSQILDRLFTFLITYSIAYKQGAQKNDLDSLAQISISFDNMDIGKLEALFSDQENGSSEQQSVFPSSFHYKFISTFFERENYNFQYFPFLAHYIHSGDLSLNVLTETAQDIRKGLKKMRKSPEEVVLSQLSRYMELDDHEIKPLIESILIYVKSGTYSIGKYAKILSQLSTISRIGIGQFQINEEVQESFRTGMVKALEHSNHIPELAVSLVGFMGTKDFFSEIKIKEVDHNRQLGYRENNEVINKVWNSFKNGRISDVKALLNGNKLANIPIFTKNAITPHAFLDSYLKLSNKLKLELIDVLINIQSIKGVITTGDTEFFDNLLALVEQEISRSSQNFQVSTLHLKNLKNDIERVLTKLKEVK